MAKKSRHEKNDFLIDYGNDLLDELNDGGEDMLAEKNRNILLSFGKNASASASGENRDASKALSPLEALKAKMGIQDADSAVKSDSATAAIPDTKASDEKPAPAVAVIPKSDKKPEKEAGIADRLKDDSQEMSLLERLKRYTTDETGHDVSEDESPLYKLESVAQIIKNDSGRFINKLSEKYDVTVDNLGRPTNDDYILKGFEDEEDEEEVKQEAAPAVDAQAEKPTPTPAFKEMASESKLRFEKSIFDELFDEGDKPQETETAGTPDISDIDNIEYGEDARVNPAAADAATVRFTPVVDKSGNTGRINISSSTKPIDIKQELTSTNEGDSKNLETPLETGDFELFAPKDEITDINAAKAKIKNLSYKKRNGFLLTGLCSICVLFLLLFLLPFIADKVDSAPKIPMIICSIPLFISIIANYDMFKDVINLFKNRAGHDCVVALCAVLSAIMCVFAVFSGKNVYHLILLASIIMLARSAINFIQTSTMLSNLKMVSAKGTKHAVTFIKDSPTALAMAKNAIEGDVLIAAPRKAEFISDFMKFSLFKKRFSGKMPIVFAVTGFISVISAVIAAMYYKTAFHAVSAAAMTSMIAAMPVICFIDTLPMFFAARRLKKKGAMITGTFAADSIELANAAVIGTSDIFPSGSVILKSFKVLSDNDIDKTLVNAAALTEAIGSPLAPIFSKIAGTNEAYEKPDYDTIKYEEKLGISGWVNDELLFIGNRTLMEAHGIEVPSIEFDRKILRRGYFPVYVSTGGHACALIVIEYTVRKDIQKTLRKISKLGITLLVDNCDPNVNEKMICDYFGIYDDSVKVMTNVGTYMYKNAVEDASTVSAPAAFRTNRFSLLNIMCCASNIRISNAVLSVFYVLAAVLGACFFIFTSFTQSNDLLSGSTLLMFDILATALGFIIFLFKKP